MIGVGNAYRGDDAAGLAVARLLRERGVEALDQEGEPVALVELLAGHGAVVLIDAVRSGASPGTVHRVDDDDQVAARPQVEQRRGVLVLEHPYAGPGLLGDRAHHRPTHGVVTPVRAAQSDHQPPETRRSVGHPRSTVRSRKCVAHEMQGS